MSNAIIERSLRHERAKVGGGAVEIPTMPRSRATAAALEQLAVRFGAKCSAALAVRDQHSETLTVVASSRPDAVVFVETTQDVVDAVRICAAEGCPIIAYGTGTSLEGHIAAVEGGVTLDFSRMNAILQINLEDFDCRVQPGVTRERLNAELRHAGLFFPVDPGADASLGGMAATAASGTTTVRYGAMRQNVLGLEVVLANGEVIRTGGRSRKSSAGYDLTKLLIGSEGTLALTTELTLRLHPIPSSSAVAVCAFPSIMDAVEATTEIMQSGIPVARIELVDALTIRAVNAFSGLELTSGDYLFLEFHGTESSVKENIETASSIAADHGGKAFQYATTTEEINRLWKARHHAALAVLALVPNSQLLVSDLCVPISRLAHCIEVTQRDIRDAGLTAMIVGHVGDGNFHVGFVLPKGDAAAHARAQSVHQTMVQRALEMEGTCTGEHGIGLGKQHYLLMEHGGAVAVMRAIKQTLDPKNILNPGKIFTAAD
jgi:D-lactate dehydrogenase (cytochrome)